MGYLGNNLQAAYSNYQLIDSLTASFNGTTTSFPLRVNGVTPVPFPLNEQNVLISVGGVPQKPDATGAEGFRFSGSNIVFSSAPKTGEAFWGVILAGADYVNVGVDYPDGSASVPSITFGSEKTTGFYRLGSGSIGVTLTGVVEAAFSGSGLSLYGSTSGTTTLTAPAVAGNNVLTLPASNGSAYQMMRNGATPGTMEFADNIVSGTAKDYNWNGLTTNTVLDFTGIPSWVKRITVMIADVSTNSGNASLLQFGSSGVIQTSNYKSRTSFIGGTTATSTSGIIWGVSGGGAVNTYRGSIVATLVGSNVWVATGMVDVQDGNTSNSTNAGRVTLSGTLDTLRVQAGTVGNETFDAGTINILYE